MVLRSRILFGWASDGSEAAFVMRMCGRVVVVGLDDALDEAVAHDVVLVEVHERNAFDVADDLDGFDQAGAARIRQIDLGYVSGDDCFRIESQTREEHFHLFAGGVLRFVKNHE